MIRTPTTFTAAICLLVLLLLPVRTAGAGEIGGIDDDRNDGKSSDSTRALLGGTVAGIAGFCVGGLVGATIDSADEYDLSGLERGLVVGSVSGGLALPLGVHGANRGRGNGWLVMGTSVAVGSAGWALALATDEWFLLPVTALGQLVACTAVEISTSPAPDAEAAAVSHASPRVTVGPGLVDGKPGLVIGGTF